MVDHYGPACVEEQGMLHYWLHHADDDPVTERLWDKPRVMTVYRRIPTPWEPLHDDGLPHSLRD